MLPPRSKARPTNRQAASQSSTLSDDTREVPRPSAKQQSQDYSSFEYQVGKQRTKEFREEKSESSPASEPFDWPEGVDPIEQAESHLRYGEPDKAVRVLEDALKENPKNSAAENMLSEIRRGERPAGQRQPSVDDTPPGALANQGPTRAEQLASRDALDRGRITNAITQLLSQRVDVTPFAIGLFGHWGSGKSSQIEFVKQRLDQLEKPHFYFAEFNAWQHENSENLAASLAQTVVEALVEKLGFFEQLILSARLAIKRKSRFTKSLRKDANRSLGGLYRFASIIVPLFAPAAIVSAVVFVALASVSPTETDTVKKLLGSASTALLALWVGWHRFISANLTRWFNRVGSTNLIGHLTLPDFSAKMGSFHEIHKTLSDLCTLQLKGNESPEDGDYLFLVIDDLDRCTPATVKQVFDVVRLVASIKRVVTLVAIDDRIAFAAVASHYTNFTATGREPAQVARDYMAKVFQVAITLPPVNSKSTGLFIRSELFRAELARPDTKTVGDPPAEPTVTIEPPKVDPESQKKVLLSALPDEVTLFELLSEETGISNPRELWRLKQAWFLLKGMVLKDGDGIAEMDPWLRSLFVREWTLRATAEVRKRFDDELEALQEGGSPSPLDAKITKILGLETANALERRAFVDAVLLPAAPAAVSATAGDAQKSNGPATSMGNASAAA